MTLSRHTFLLKIAIATAAVSLAGIILVSGNIIPLYPKIVAEAVHRSGFPFFSKLIPGPDPYAAYFSMLISVSYGLFTLIALFYLFEKTESVEVHFFVFFALSAVFEVLRAVLPLRIILSLPDFYLGMDGRLLVFFRYFGVFSLFFASLYSSGLKPEKEENIIFSLGIVTMFIAFRLPVNRYTWDTALCIVNGYPMSFRIIEIVITVLTTLSFFSGAYRRGINEYYSIGLGALLATAGRNILFELDSYIVLPFATIILAAGTYIICVNLRKIYLWT